MEELMHSFLSSNNAAEIDHLIMLRCSKSAVKIRALHWLVTCVKSTVAYFHNYIYSKWHTEATLMQGSLCYRNTKQM